MFLRTLILALVSSTLLIAGARQIDASNFNQEIASGTTLVDFYATWCGPCQRLAPVIDDVADEMKGKASVVKINAEKYRELMSKYNVQSFPTMILFKNGQEVGRLTGFRNKDQIITFIESRSK